jgi:cytochrome c oxidase subunit I+III
MAVSVPAGIQVFAWIATLAAGKMRFNTPGLFVRRGLVIFVMGGLTGVMVAMVPFDWQAHDSYFIVAHLHYVLIGGMVFPLFAAIYYWTPMSPAGRSASGWGKWVFWLMFSGMHITFLPMHLTGLMGMPRRVYTYLPAGAGTAQSDLDRRRLRVRCRRVAVDRRHGAQLPALRRADAGNIHDGPGLEWLPAGAIRCARSR